MTDSFDVIVLGAGFGGSLLATIFSRSGLKVGLLDRASHPRFAIGESSTPAADFLLHELATRYGLTELLPLTRFGTWRAQHPEILCGCKRGFSYFWHGDGSGFQAADDHRCELLVTANASRDVADTQWYRPDTDSFFLQVARNHGVRYRDRAAILSIEHPRSHEWSIAVEREGETSHWDTPFIVDASGTSGELLRRLNLEDWSDQLLTHSYAVFGHWEHVRLLDDWLLEHRAKREDYPYPPADSAVHHLFSDGWLWQLRFEGGLTSLGYVFHGDPGPELPPAEEMWKNLLQSKPVLNEVLGSPLPAHFPGRLFRTDRLQRLWSQAAGEDWAALPFTVGFIDPLHSTGIAHTLSGVDRLSRILSGTREPDRAASLQHYSTSLINELRHIDRLVSCCYDSLENFELFTACSMLYFAAATTFEREWTNSPTRSTGFLCADDNQFVQLVQSCSSRIHELKDTARLTAPETERIIRELRTNLEPYNHVGLFLPEVPNMYRYTAADKSV